MNRSEILAAAEAAITVDRAAVYGPAKDAFEGIAAGWEAYLGDQVSITSWDVAAMMTIFKMHHVRNSPKHTDSWVDAAGYSALGGELATPTSIGEDE